jgi:hypothetical protein
MESARAFYYPLGEDRLVAIDVVDIKLSWRPRKDSRSRDLRVSWHGAAEQWITQSTREGAHFRDRVYQVVVQYGRLMV